MSEKSNNQKRLPCLMSCLIVPLFLFLAIGGAVGGAVLAAYGWECKGNINAEGYFEAKWYGMLVGRTKSAEFMIRMNEIGPRVAGGIGAALGALTGGGIVLILGRKRKLAWRQIPFTR